MSAKSPLRFVRAPFFLVLLLLSILATLPVFASVTVGSWVEDAFRRLGYPLEPPWLAGAAGWVLFLTFGMLLPMVGGYALGGWVAALVAPIPAFLLVAWLGRW